MKTVRIPAEVEARIVHECPRLTRLLSSDDGRLEVEKFIWLLFNDDSEGGPIDRIREDAWNEGYDAGFLEGQDDR